MAAGIQNRSIIWQIAEDFSHCEFLIRLPGYCPMPAFRDVIDVPLVVRRLHKSRAELAGWQLKKEYIPDGWICLGKSCLLILVKLPKEFYTPDAIAASDVMLEVGRNTIMVAEAKNCTKPSGKYHGPCITSRDCAAVCQKLDKLLDGKCGGGGKISDKCMCITPC
nr:Arabinose kinase isoform 1 [Ipomoea batatas]